MALPGTVRVFCAMSDTAPIEHPTWLTSGDFTEAEEPLRLWQAWFEEAVKAEPRDPNAMSLATVDPDGMPDVRTVLLKGVDARGFVFYTNTESQKGRELAANPKAGAAVLLEVAEPAGAHPRARSSASRPRRPTPISRRARRARRSAPGRASSRARSKAGSPSRRRSRFTARNTRSAPCRARRTGRAIGSCLSRSSSGTTGRSACTTGSSFAAPRLGAPWTKVRMYPVRG